MCHSAAEKCGSPVHIQGIEMNKSALSNITIGGCSWVERKELQHETAHIKVCGLTLITGSMLLSFTGIFFQLFVYHKSSTF